MTYTTGNGKSTVPAMEPEPIPGFVGDNVGPSDELMVTSDVMIDEEPMVEIIDGFIVGKTDENSVEAMIGSLAGNVDGSFDGVS